MRAPGAILSTAALLWGLYQAPFLHIHPEDLDHPPVSAPVHTHVHGVAAPGVVIDAFTADDDAVDIGWNPQPPSSAGFDAPVEVSEALPDLPLTRASAPVTVPRPKGHDPPEATPKQPRAPPA